MSMAGTATTELAAALTEVLSGGVASLDLAACDRRLDGCRRIRSAVAAAEAELLVAQRRLVADAARAASAGAAGSTDDASREGAQPQLPPPPAAARESARVRARRVLRSKWLAFYPVLAEALAADRITAEHVDVLAVIFEHTAPKLIAEFDAGWLVRNARSSTPEGFARDLRDELARLREDGGASEYQRQLQDSYASMSLDRVSGLYTLRVVLDPVRGPQLQSALDHRIAQLRRQRDYEQAAHGKVMLQAVWDLAMGGVEAKAESIVVVDHRTATAVRQHAHTVCENIDGVSIPIDLAVAHTASAVVTAAIVDSTGLVVDFGCAAAHASSKQRRLQRSMYRTCAHPGCDVAYSRCEIHHVQFTRHGGRTVMSNLVPLCKRHHHDVHDRDWQLAMTPERQLTWRRPDGSIDAIVDLRRLDGNDPPERGQGDGEREGAAVTSRPRRVTPPLAPQSRRASPGDPAPTTTDPPPMSVDPPPRDGRTPTRSSDHGQPSLFQADAA